MAVYSIYEAIGTNNIPSLQILRITRLFPSEDTVDGSVANEFWQSGRNQSTSKLIHSLKTVNHLWRLLCPCAKRGLCV